MFATFALVVGVAAMAPATQLAQADWLDVRDFGCVGVNNCNPETCTDSSNVEVGTAQEGLANNGGITTQTSTTALTPVTPFTCIAGEAEVEVEEDEATTGVADAFVAPSIIG